MTRTPTIVSLVVPGLLSLASGGIAAATPAQVRAFPAGAPVRAPARTVRKAPLASLHLDGTIASAVCGRALEFSITIANSSATAFAGGAWLRLSGGTIASDPRLGAPIMTRIQSIPANGQQTFKLKANDTDCQRKEDYEVVLLGNPPYPLPDWDAQALVLTTTPPTECRATTSEHKYHWSPKN